MFFVCKYSQLISADLGSWLWLSRIINDYNGLKKEEQHGMEPNATKYHNAILPLIKSAPRLRNQYQSLKLPLVEFSLFHSISRLLK